MNVKISSDHWLSANPFAIRFFMLAIFCIVAATLIGLVAAVKIADPGFATFSLPYQRLRPMHTFFSIAALVSGLLALIAVITHDSQRSNAAMRCQLIAMTLFIALGAITLSAGMTSGREYFSWHPALSVLLITAVASAAGGIFRNWRVLSARSPESFWLIGFGYVFVLVGLIESHLWLLPAIGYNSIKDLTVQWHGLDVFFAGINAALYGAAIQVASQRVKSLRSRWLFVLAIASLLFTFGHHHYVSPQPGFLKVLALVASMLAMVSFIRHMRAAVRMGGQSGPVAPLLKAVETWTLVAAGSGILMAIPHVNTLLHGTYAVVIHAMGSMIGVNLMIILAGGFAAVGIERAVTPRRIRLAVRTINYSLSALWLLLTAHAVMEGVSRTTTDYIVILANLWPMLFVFPIVGAFLLFGLVFICVELWRICWAALAYDRSQDILLQCRVEND